MLPYVHTVLRNRAKCLACAEIIESTDDDEVIWCSCGNLGVSGGLDYIHRVQRAKGWQEMAEVKSPGSPAPRVEFAVKRMVSLPE